MFEEVLKLFEEVVKLFESVLIDLSGFGLYTDIEELEDAWKELEESRKIGPCIPPKKYGISLRCRSRKMPARYHYIPQLPRNQPYQRRSY